MREKVVFAGDKMLRKAARLLEDGARQKEIAPVEKLHRRVGGFIHDCPNLLKARRVRLATLRRARQDAPGFRLHFGDHDSQPIFRKQNVGVNKRKKFAGRFFHADIARRGNRRICRAKNHLECRAGRGRLIRQRRVLRHDDDFHLRHVEFERENPFNRLLQHLFAAFVWNDKRYAHNFLTQTPQRTQKPLTFASLAPFAPLALIF